MLTQQHIYLLISLVATASLTRADDQAKPAPYPQWVTNDYNCVIGCMQQFFTDTKPPATNDQTNNAMGCVRSSCSKDTENANIYQAQYIINMYNQIGSIYEPQGWQDGNIPTTASLTAPSGWVQTTVTNSYSKTDGSWETSTDTAWAPPADASPTDGTTPQGQAQDQSPSQGPDQANSGGQSGGSAGGPSSSGGGGTSSDIKTITAKSSGKSGTGNGNGTDPTAANTSNAASRNVFTQNGHGLPGGLVSPCVSVLGLIVGAFVLR